MEKVNEKCPFDDKKLTNTTKDTVNIVRNWYQSVYFWQLAYNQANFSYSFAQNNNNNNTNTISNHHTHNRTRRNTYVIEEAPRQHQHQIPLLLNQLLNQNQNQRANEFYKVPSILRRVVAETFDIFYIQIFKIIILFLIMNYTDLISNDVFNITEFIENLLSEDNLLVSFELLFLEFLYFGISVVFESICLYKWGFTPGKYLFKLKVVSCTQINEQANSLVQVIPGTPLSFRSVCIRTIVKNCAMMFLFPTIIIFVFPAFMEYGQTSYDKASESIVVETVQS